MAGDFPDPWLTLCVKKDTGRSYIGAVFSSGFDDDDDAILRVMMMVVMTMMMVVMVVMMMMIIVMVMVVMLMMTIFMVIVLMMMVIKITLICREGKTQVGSQGTKGFVEGVAL